ncbi:cyclase family protein [Gordonia polyisoprenivorans]|uniref:cyclase family protein n=1 Tax=Gordonia polyisoprenivorans TaxID=84595 RepID=UPI0019F487ED|nr:cyclase family protein [Gordonia polyisoprenivorans]MBE7191117.1 cyclase family protein [Gordonia polyisoprenivorans]QUD83591.1 cyclase family protein [Gordonia polyisoprenivorans]UZF55447.1 cyclase family protein [Gordonia polyisoprenivorans]
MSTPNATTIAELLGSDSPTNWGKWGTDDEVGSLNYLDAAAVLRGVAAVATGEVFTLQIPIGDPEHPDPVWPGRTPAVRTQLMDEGFFIRGEEPEPSDGHHWADDKIEMYTQGSTQYDALAHYWYDGKVWNGKPAETTVGALQHASVLPIAERGVVGRGVLIDVARARGVDALAPGEQITLDELLAVASAQGTTIAPRDILLVRTGWIGSYYRTTSDEFYRDWNEPGLVYSRDLVDWFHTTEIPNLVTDTIANELSFYPGGIQLPLHCALMRNLGVAFTEMCQLDDLAAACAADRRWEFLYTAAPLKITGASGAPVNPIAIR